MRGLGPWEEAPQPPAALESIREPGHLLSAHHVPGGTVSGILGVELWTFHYSN